MGGMIDETVDWLNDQGFARSGLGVEYNATHDGSATTTHYTFNKRLGTDGSTIVERTSEHTHPFDAPCADCARLV